MIGNAYPWKHSGFVILEEGDIEPLTLVLKVSRYRVTDRYGQPVGEGFSSLDAAGQFIDELLALDASEGNPTP